MKKLFLYVFLIFLFSSFHSSVNADAVVITTSLKSVNYNGHTSVIAQDKEGEWFYFYWGDHHAYLKPVPKESMKNIDAFNTWLKEAVKSMPTSNRYYNFGTYIKGDFTESLRYYKQCVKSYSTCQFLTWFNNCACKSFKGLRLGILPDGNPFESKLIYRWQDYIPVWSTRPHTFRQMVEQSFTDFTLWGNIINSPSII